MQERRLSLGSAKVRYFTSGTNPKLLLSSGVHGDESGVIVSVRKMVDKCLHHLPDFVFIPVVSPSAVTLGTRKNGQGVDLNRSFIPNTIVDEALAAQKIVANNHFDLHIDFHEDPHSLGFYVYDYRVGNGLPSKDVLSLLSGVRDLGVCLYSGIDDDDEALKNKVVGGYCAPSLNIRDGSFDNWARKSGVVKRSLAIEIPGRLPQGKKDRIVEIIFGLFTKNPSGRV